jgi:hypothetical protein
VKGSSGPATRGAARTPRLLAALLGAAVLASPVAADDEAWKERIAGELARVEMGVAALDGRSVAAGDPVARVRALDERLSAIEKAEGLPVGEVAAKDDLASLTQDVSRLSTRWKAILEKRDPSADPTPAPRREVPRPKPPARPEWPTLLPFHATAKIAYEPVGQHHPEYFAPNFLLHGYRGAVSFSLRARGLVREAASARVEVLVRTQPPFGSTTLRYEVSWVPETGVLGDGALKTWTEFDHREATVLPHWVHRPIGRNARTALDLRAEAHVLSLVTRAGETVSFETPTTPMGLPAGESEPASPPVSPAAPPSAPPAAGPSPGPATPFATLAAALEERVARARADVAARGRLARDAAAQADPEAWRPYHDAYATALAAAILACETAAADLAARTSDVDDPKVAALVTSAMRGHADVAAALHRSRVALAGVVALVERLDAAARPPFLRSLAGAETYVVE